MKTCSVCNTDITDIKDPALLFIGRYGYKFEICSACEEYMDNLVSPETEDAEKDAVEYFYAKLFDNKNGKCHPDVIKYIASIVQNDEAAIEEAAAAIEEAENPPENDGEAEKNEQGEDDEGLIEEAPTPLSAKIIALVISLLICGAVIFYGIKFSYILSTIVGIITAVIAILIFLTDGIHKKK